MRTIHTDEIIKNIKEMCKMCIRDRLYTFMKIICTKSDLVHAVSIVSKAVSNNTTLPILKCILIEASTGLSLIHI